MGRVLILFLAAFVAVHGAEKRPSRSTAAKHQKLSRAAATEQFDYLVVLFHSGTPEDVMDSVLLRAGVHLVAHPDLVAGQRLIRATLDQMIEVADLDEVAYVFPASADLVDGLPLIGCAGPVATEDSTDKTEHLANYITTVGDGWAHGHELQLTYSVGRESRQLSAGELRPLIERALTAWSRPARIAFRFTEDVAAERNLNFLFASGAHGDSAAFDGRGRVLGHTFYPAGVNREPLAGDVHIDDDEAWGTKLDPDLYSVILHEIGHALGLGHADRPGSVMYPYYRKLDTLQPDDIAALLRMYPERTVSEPAPTAPTIAPLTLAIGSPSLAGSVITLQGMIAGGKAPYRLSWFSAGQTATIAATANWTLNGIPAAVAGTAVQVVVVDSEGTMAFQSVTVERQQVAPTPPSTDKTAPQLTITYPALGNTATSAAVSRIQGTARDAGGLQEITWRSSSGASGAANGTSSWRADGIPLVQGDNVISITARDGSGNATTRTVTITRR